MTRGQFAILTRKDIAQWLTIMLAAVLISGSVAQAEVSFMRDVAPVLVRRCIACHGERKDSGDYRAHTFEALMRRGSSDDAPIVPGKPQASLLYKLIASKDTDERMPQKDDALSTEQVELIRQWIEQGAKFDGTDRTTSIKTLMGPRDHPAPPKVYRAPVPIMALKFMPGGKQLAAGGYHEVTMWDASSGALLQRFAHLPQRVQAIVFSPDGNQMVVAGGMPGDYGEVATVDLPSGRVKVLDTFDDIVLSAALSADAKLIAVGGADLSVRVYDRATGKRIWMSRLHSDWITGVSFSADGRFVASSSKDKNVKVYETATGTLYTSYTGHHRQVGPYAGDSPVYDVAFGPEGAMVASAGGGKWVQLWDPEKARAEAGTAAELEGRFAKDGHTRYIEHGFQGDVLRLVVGSGELFAASCDGPVKLFDCSTLKLVRSFEGLHDWVAALDVENQSHHVAGGAMDGRVCVWDSSTGNIVASFFASPGYVARGK